MPQQTWTVSTPNHNTQPAATTRTRKSGSLEPSLHAHGLPCVSSSSALAGLKDSRLLPFVDCPAISLGLDTSASSRFQLLWSTISFFPIEAVFSHPTQKADWREKANLPGNYSVRTRCKSAKRSTGRSLLLHVVPGGLRSLHTGSCVWRHQSQDSLCNQANDYHHDESCRLKDRRGLRTGGSAPGEDAFKDAHKELGDAVDGAHKAAIRVLSLIHISEPTRLGMISYAVFCLKKKKTRQTQLAG